MLLYFEDAFVQKKAKLLTEMMEFAAKQLLGTKQPNIVITIESEVTTAYHVTCEWEDRPINPREFKIVLSSKITLGELGKALFHEMVHVKQMYKGELKQRKNQQLFWKGEHVPNEIAYHELPWEIEAYRMQEELAEKYLEMIGG